ncbi:MAG: alpha-galactosidase [Desulfosarcinaceae bacterium]|nr:alpha-galactosidase [Desulfosarcinaceae bacterium]
MAYHRLDGQRTSLVFDLRGAVPVCCYWGSRLADDLPLSAFDQLHWQPKPPAVLDAPVGLTLLPENGRGWWGQPALRGSRAGRHWSNAFTLAESDLGAAAVRFTLVDAAAQLTVQLRLDLDRVTDVLRQRCVLINTGTRDYHLEWCAAATFPLPPEVNEILMFEGRWAKEFGVRRQPFPTGALIQDNTRGRTSHAAFPGAVVGRQGFDESGGTVYGFHLGWSGNHRTIVERTSEGWRQIQLGERLMPGEVILGPGQRYLSPSAYACCAEGMNELSVAFHGYMRAHILPTQVARTPRPVQYNTWEAVYFDHDLTVLKALASRAAALGVERFVLDDGWFSGRTDDGRALGDWTPDPMKYPQGLAPLIDHVNRCGMTFGLWAEPEMVSPDSDLYRRHPEWALNLDPLPRATGRHQLVLDLSLPAVSDYLFDRLHALLVAHPIVYLKWDMNRDLTTAGHDGRPAHHDQVTSLYALIDRLRQAHPDVEIETCASGGARVDFEILKRTHRVWISDSNDALERQQIQRGFSLFFPPEIMGCHVGPTHSHTSGRTLGLDFRGITAFGGHLGLELDLRTLRRGEIDDLKALIAIHKAHRDLLHGGRHLRLMPLDPQRSGWGAVALDRREAIYALMQVETPAPGASLRVTLPGLAPQTPYRVKPLLPGVETRTARTPTPPWYAEGLLATGELLAKAGLHVALPNPASGMLLKAVAEET